MADTSVPKPETGEFAASAGGTCRYAMFNRRGGLSSGPYASLNVGDRLGDLKEAVQENRSLVKRTMVVSRLLSARQIHGTGIYCLTDYPSGDREVEDSDALITDLADVGLMIQQADCQAVLLFDPVRQVIAAVHCGWRGSVQGILGRVVAVMTENYGTVPAELQAVISPSLGPCCAEFINYRQELPEEFRRFMVRPDYFDFWAISRYQLEQAGMSRQRVRVAGVCTCCSDDYFSYRRATRKGNGLTGRNCSVIALDHGISQHPTR